MGNLGAFSPDLFWVNTRYRSCTVLGKRFNKGKEAGHNYLIIYEMLLEKLLKGKIDLIFFPGMALTEKSQRGIRKWKGRRSDGETHLETSPPFHSSGTKTSTRSTSIYSASTIHSAQTQHRSRHKDKANLFSTLEISAPIAE